MKITCLLYLAFYCHRYMKEYTVCKWIEIQSYVTYLNSKLSLKCILIKMVDSMPEDLLRSLLKRRLFFIFH